MKSTLAVLFLIPLVGCNAVDASGLSPVVELRVDGHARCSGVVISETEVVTAAHCADGLVEIGGMEVAGVRAHGAVDLAIVDVESTQGLPFAALGAVSARGALVGYGCEGRLLESPHEALRHDGDDVLSYGRACAGDSGGGLFNDRGELVGVHSMTSGQAISVRAALLQEIE